MKNKFALIIMVLFIISAPFLAWNVLQKLKVEPVPIVVQKPELPQQSDPPIVEAQPTKPEIKKPDVSEEFLQGYWDGFDGKMIGPVKWIIQSDYRAGHALGAHDKKHDIKRYDRKP